MSGLKRILVVDDEPDILTVTRFTLRKRGGFEVETCGSSVAAPETAAGFAPDLILLDVMMPEQDGPATLRALRADPRTAGIPVIFMTAKAMADEQEHFRKLGAVGVITKPFDQATLADEVRRLFASAADGAPAPADGDAGDDIFAAYAARLPGRVAEVEAAWERGLDGDVAELRTLVHRLAGTGGSYGYSRLSEVALELERVLDEAGAFDERRRQRVGALLGALAEATRTPDEPAGG